MKDPVQQEVGNRAEDKPNIYKKGKGFYRDWLCRSLERTLTLPTQYCIGRKIKILLNFIKKICMEVVVIQENLSGLIFLQVYVLHTNVWKGMHWISCFPEMMYMIIILMWKSLLCCLIMPQRFLECQFFDIPSLCIVLQ